MPCYTHNHGFSASHSILSRTEFCVAPFVHHLLLLAVLLQAFMLLLSSPRLHFCLTSALNCAVLELLCQGRLRTRGSSRRGALSQHLLGSGFAWLHFKDAV